MDNKYFRSSSPIGEPIKHLHTDGECCGILPHKSPAMNVTQLEDGWIWYCFRCQKGGKKHISSLAPAAYRAWINRPVIQPNQVVKQVELPIDFTENIPPIGKVWLYKYGITDEEIKYYNIGYSAYFGRVIMPVYEGEKLIFWIGRNIGEVTMTNPKYKTVKNYKRKNIYFKVEPEVDKIDGICIVEDALSAIKVGRHTVSYALIAAHVPDKLILDIRKRVPIIYLWLDPDKQDKMIKWVQRYTMMGVNIKMIVSDKDPKEYNNKQIIGYLND